MTKRDSMKVTYNWLKDFVEIKLPAGKLADKLTMAGLEVTSLEKKAGDFVFEIEITSNRPDWLSVAGVAREVAAITNGKIKKHPQVKNIGLKKEKEFLQIEIEDKKDCPLYTAKIIRDVKIASTPDWMRKRLELVGLNSINNAVDVTNYILFSYGHPLHAFDLDKLISVSERKPAITVRRARPAEEIVTIDGEKRLLSQDVLVIASGKKPVALAGIMGGKDTEVDENTKNILLESAIFNPVVIRRSRQKLCLQTDSSYRFERGSFVKAALDASSQAAQEITNFCRGRVVLEKNKGLIAVKNKIVKLDVLTVSRVLGVPVPIPRIKKILAGLGFAVSTKGLSVGIPDFRPDIKSEIDLVEEIARIWGFEKIPVTLPAFHPQLLVPGSEDLVPLVKNILLAQGITEAITYSLVDRKVLEGCSTTPVEVANPLSKEQEVLRTTLIPSLLKCTAYNLNQKQEPVNIFEIAKIFSGQPSGALREELVLSIALCGERTVFTGTVYVQEEMGILHLKGILEMLFSRLGIKEYAFKQSQENIAVIAGGEKVGVASQTASQVLEKFDIKNKNVATLELNLDKILLKADLKKKFVSLPLYPGVYRDISFIVEEKISSAEMVSAIKENGALLLAEAKITDFYKGKQIPAGFKAMTISCFYRSGERTLTEAELTPLHSAICAMLTERFNVKIR